MAAPTYLPEWAVEDVNLPSTGKANKQRPKESLRNIGWDKGQIPSAEEFNWTLNNYYLWMRYIINEALPTYLPITGTELDFTGNIQGTATWKGDKVTSVNLKSDLDTSTSLNSQNTLVKRSPNGDIAVNNFTSYGDITVTNGETTLQKTKISSVDIDAGTIDGTTIGASAASPATFSYLTAKNDINFTGGITSSGTNGWTGSNTFSNIDVNGGSIDNTSIGSATPAPAVVSTFRANNVVTLVGGVTSTGTNTFSGSNTFSNKLNLQTSNLGQTGYTYLPNGVIMQWGYINAGDDSWTQINFPIPFPNLCTSLTANADYNGAITGQNSLSTHTHVDSASVGHVGITWTSSTSIPINGFSWLAIGY